MLTTEIPYKQAVSIHDAKHLHMHTRRQTCKSTHPDTHLLGDGGVWRDMVGTPVVGVIWLGSWVPCVKLRFNWGVLLPMPLIEKPSAPTEREQGKRGRQKHPKYSQVNQRQLFCLQSKKKKKFNDSQAYCTAIMYSSSELNCISTHTAWVWDIYTKKPDNISVKKLWGFLGLLCGPYKLAPSCDSWPDEDGEGDDSIWGRTDRAQWDNRVLLCTPVGERKKDVGMWEQNSRPFPTDVWTSTAGCSTYSHQESRYRLPRQTPQISF